MPAPRPLATAAVCFALTLIGLASSPRSEAKLSETYTAPNAIEPPPVNPVIEAEFVGHVKEWDERGRLAAGVSEGEVRLSPALEGGWVGWCMTVRVGADRATRCPVAPTTREAIGYESWEAGGAGTRGVALVNAPNEAVAVDEASSTETAAPISGVAEVSAALVEIPAAFPAPSHWFDEFEPVYNGMRDSGGRGFSAPQRAHTASLPALSWRAGEHPPAGVCSITAAHLAGLRARFGHVVTSVAPTPSLAGGGFASCIDTEYSLGRSSLDAAVLLNASEPGSAAPLPLPSATVVRRHAGLFSAPGWNGEILARRVGDAWLVVEGGSSLRQRIQVLSHLQASVRI